MAAISKIKLVYPFLNIVLQFFLFNKFYVRIIQSYWKLGIMSKPDYEIIYKLIITILVNLSHLFTKGMLKLVKVLAIVSFVYKGHAKVG